MALYVDSADRSAVEPLLATGLFAGMTTNPTILSRAGLTQKDLAPLHAWAQERGCHTMFMQAVGTTVEDLTTNALALSRIGDGVVVKVPCHHAGLSSARRLADDGVPCLVTAVYHPSQALLAAAAGAAYIAPYVGRMTDNGRDGVQTAGTIQRVLQGCSTRVLVASIRTPDEVAELSSLGVPDFALNPGLCQALLSDALTEEAADEFERVAAGARGT